MDTVTKELGETFLSMFEKDRIEKTMKQFWLDLYDEVTAFLDNCSPEDSYYLQKKYWGLLESMAMTADGFRWLENKEAKGDGDHDQRA
jgi:hypothetical protein